MALRHKDVEVIDPPSPAAAMRPLVVSRRTAESARALNAAFAKQVDRLAKSLDVMTAASQILDPNDPTITGMAQGPNAVSRTWQHAAQGFSRSIGELSAAKMYVGNCLSRVDLIVGKRSPNGEMVPAFKGEDPVEGVDPAIADEANEIVGSLRSPRGGQKQLMRDVGEQIFLTGELYLVPETTPSGKVYEVLSTQELMPNGTTFIRYNGPGYATKQLPEGTKPIRIWKPDSQFHMLATSSVQACLIILEELDVLTRLVKASAICRMALSGILLIPDELDMPQDEEAPDGGQSEAMNGLAVDIINTAAKAVQDPSSAASFVPYILQGPAEYLEKVRHIVLQASGEEHILQRTEALLRLAQSLDMAVETVLGHQGTTFANAAQISIDTFKIHIEPTVELLVDALTTSVLWPEMAVNRGIDADHLKDAPYPPEIMTVGVFYDASKLISRPDRLEQLVDAWRNDESQMAIRISELREALGLAPDTPPDEKESSARIDAKRLIHIREIITAPPSDAAVPLADAIAGKAVMPGASAGAGLIGKEQISSIASQAEAEDAPGSPTANAAEATKQAELGASGLAHLLAGAGELTAQRAVDRIGARVNGRAGSLTPEQRTSIAGLENCDIPRTLGNRTVASVLKDDDPVAHEVTLFREYALDLAVVHGHANPQGAADAAAELVRQAAWARLYSDASAAFSVTASGCQTVLTASG